jgi:P27 family predicted phage terminase small subunit
MPGPPKAPLEERRRKGRSPGRDSGGRKLLEPAQVVQLHSIDGQAAGVPDTIEPEGAGAARWASIWREATWLSLQTDRDVVTRLCELEDLRQGMKVALADSGFFVTGSQGQQRPNPLLVQIRDTERLMLSLEKECGLTPSSRGSLGVAEVIGPEATNPLEAILRRAAGGRGGRGA